MVMLLAGRAEVVSSIPLSDHSNNKIVYVLSARVDFDPYSAEASDMDLIRTLSVGLFW